MLHKDIKTRKNRLGEKGLFALKYIKKGEVIWKLDKNEKILTYEERDNLPPKTRKLAFQYKNGFIVVSDGSQFMNHSCDPNTWWTKDNVLSASRDIKAREEVTYDYSTADVGEWTASWECACGTDYCRKRITGKDCLNTDFQKRYKNHLPSWVENFILKKMKSNCDCIIPFYNEDIRPLGVVEALLKLKHLSKIITVDDGSKDRNTYTTLKKKFSSITSIRLDKNSGKAKAVEEGLKYVTAKYLLLMDGDLTNIKTDELENAISKITNNPEIDMIILRRVEDKTVVVSRLIRHDIIFSGQRILRTDDLKKVFQSKLYGYQLEVAINTYMTKNHKTVFWMPFSIHNLYKFDKRGFIEGWRVGSKMFAGFVNYAGWRNFLNQTVFFCRKEAP